MGSNPGQNVRQTQTSKCFISSKKHPFIIGVQILCTIYYAPLNVSKTFALIITIYFFFFKCNNTKIKDKV